MYTDFRRLAEAKANFYSYNLLLSMHAQYFYISVCYKEVEPIVLKGIWVNLTKPILRIVRIA